MREIDNNDKMKSLLCLSKYLLLIYLSILGYQTSPDLRLTWLENMANKHIEQNNMVRVFFYSIIQMIHFFIHVQHVQIQGMNTFLEYLMKYKFYLSIYEGWSRNV